MGISEENNNIAGMQEDDAAVVYEAESCLELENAEWDTHAISGVNYLPESEADDQAEYECFDYDADMAEACVDDQVDFQTDCQAEADSQAECAVAEQTNGPANIDSTASDRKKTASAGRISHKEYLELVRTATAIEQNTYPEDHPESPFRVTLDTYDSFWDVFAAQKPQFEEEIVFWSGDRHESYTLKELNDYSFFKRVLETFPKGDLYYSIESYKIKHKLRNRHVFAQLPTGEAMDALLVERQYADFSDDNRFATYAVGIDVDYKKVFEARGQKAQCTPEQFFYYLMECVGDRIPMPTHIECGHQLRLIYVLKEPIGNVTEQGLALQRGVDRFVQAVCDVILDEFPDSGAEPQKKFARFPGSINTKDGSFVYTKKVGDIQYTGQELISEYLPDLPVPPEEYRKILVEREERRKNGNGQAGNHFWANVLIGLRTRCEDLKKLRQKPGIHREELVFIYGTAFFPVHSDITQGEFIDALLEFNAGFPNPLTTKEVKSKCSGLYRKMKSPKAYKYRNTTIINKFGITEEDVNELGLVIGMSRTLREKLLREERGEACWQKIEARTEKIKHYYEEGFSREDIAKALNVSFSTVRDTIVRLRKEMTREELNSIRAKQEKRKDDKSKLKTFIACEEMAKKKAEKEAEKARKKAEKETEKEEKKRRAIEKAMRREAKEDDLRKRIAYTLGMEREEVERIFKEDKEGRKDLMKLLVEAEREESLAKRADWAKDLKPLFWMSGEVRCLIRAYHEYEPRLLAKLKKIKVRWIGGKLYALNWNEKSKKPEKAATNLAG